MHEDGSTVEEWREVVGFDGYEVSNLGRVRSWRSRNGRGRAAEPHMLRLEVRARYLYAVLGGKAVRLHRLVLAAFVGPCPAGMQGCHNDGDPMNNRLPNLRWDSPRNNTADQVGHGTKAAGERCGHAKLTWEQVREIRTRRAEGGAALARAFGISQPTASEILRGVTWRE